MAKTGWGAVLGSAGAVVSCTPMIFAAVPALAGVFGATAASSAGMMMMSSAAPYGHKVPPPWVGTIGHYAGSILLVSLALLAWGALRAPSSARWVVGAGMVLLIWNYLAMSAGLFVVALVLIVAGNIWAWRLTQAEGRIGRA
jgi:hypothetical protein